LVSIAHNEGGRNRIYYWHRNVSIGVSLRPLNGIHQSIDNEDVKLGSIYLVIGISVVDAKENAVIMILADTNERMECAVCIAHGCVASFKLRTAQGLFKIG
jgi:hypothetical protein